MRTGRTPVDQMARSIKPVGREALWPLIREMQTFTVSDLRDRTDMPRKTILDYLTGLAASGRLARAEPVAPNPVTFTLVRDTGVEVPRVRKDGSEVTHGRGTEQLWRTMKIVREFTVESLATAASTKVHAVSMAQAQSYVGWLVRAGYLRTTVEGKGGRPSQYRLIRNTGLLPPMIQRVPQVWDPNLQEVVWPEASS